MSSPWLTFETTKDGPLFSLTLRTSSLPSRYADSTDLLDSLSLSLSLSLCLSVSVSVSLSISSCLPSLFASRLVGTQCPHRVDECKFLLVDQHCCLCVVLHSTTSLINSSLFFLLSIYCSLFEGLRDRGRWSYSGCLVGFASRIYKNSTQYPCIDCVSLFPHSTVQVVQPYSCADTVTALKLSQI